MLQTHQRPLPPYLMVVAHYRDLITRGALSNGDAIPPARELARRWNIAHGTAMKALATLRSEGLTISMGGRAGTLVNATGVERPRSERLTPIGSQTSGDPFGEFVHIAAAESVPAPEAIAGHFHMSPGTPVVVRRHVILDRGVPVAVSTSWFPADLVEIAPALLITEPLKRGTPRYIQERTGRRVATSREQLSSGLAGDDVAVTLGVAAGDPVLIGRSWFRDDTGVLMEFDEYISINRRGGPYPAGLA